MKKIKVLVGLTLALLLLCSCSKLSSKTIVVAADHTYSKVLTEDFIAGFNKQTPGIKLEFVYGSSADMKRGIENGDKVDVFLSADAAVMDSLTTQGLVDVNSVTSLMTNSIVLIAPNDSSLSAATPEDIVSIKRFAFPDPDRVQSGTVCKEALKEAGIWDKVRGTAIYTTSEPEVLNFVSTGEADAGLVYSSTAATAADRVKVITTVSGENFKGAVLSGAVVKSSTAGGQAQKFLQYLTSEEAKGSFSAAGFTFTD